MEKSNPKNGEDTIELHFVTFYRIRFTTDRSVGDKGFSIRVIQR